MGGIGKTQLACEFVHRYGQFLAGGVFWVSFADPAAVPAEIVACSTAEHLALRPAWDLLAVDSACAWCRLPGNRLCPACWSSTTARISLAAPVTSHHGWRLRVDHQPAGTLGRGTERTNPAAGAAPRTDSVTLLRRFVPHQHNGETTLDAIAAQVGDLPLALHLVGRHLQHYEYAVSLQAYLAELDAAILEHRSLQGGGYSPTGHDQHVAQTFAISYDRLDSREPTDGVVLALVARAACFAPGEPIERASLRSTLGEAVDDLVFQDALARLLALGLVEQGIGGAIRMHRLVIAFVQQRQSNDGALAAVEQRLTALVSHHNEQTDVQALLHFLRAYVDPTYQVEPPFTEDETGGLAP